MERGRGRDPGGIAALADELEAHGGAIDADLMRLSGLRVRLADVPGTIGWDGLRHLMEHAGEESAWWRERNPGLAGFAGGLRTNAMLADLIDSVRGGITGVKATIAQTHVPPPQPYPRPKEFSGARTVGKGAIPVKDFWKWYNEGGA